MLIFLKKRADSSSIHVLLRIYKAATAVPVELPKATSSISMGF
jgi:hypothetical protein